MPGSSTTSASAPTSATSCGNWRGSIAQTEYVLICQPRDRELALSLGDNFRVERRALTALFAARADLDSLDAACARGPTCCTSRTTCCRRWSRCRSVVTIHDCIHLRFPQYLPNRAALHLRPRADGHGGPASDRILTVSEASKRDILQFFDVPPEKIIVIHNAIDEQFAAPPHEEDVQRVRRALPAAATSSSSTSATSSRTRTSSA